MSYLDTYIPRCGAYGWQGGPEFKTRIVEMKSGRERRNAEIAYARHSFTVPFQNISPEDYAGIKRLQLVARGMLHNFKFRDELDYEADDEPFATGDGTTKVFQLRKISTIDGVSYDRNCYVIRPGVVITDNHSLVTPTVDYDRGLVTFSVAPVNAHVLRWTGEFDLWVRFNQDDLPFSIDNLRVRTGAVNIIEDVPPPLP